MSALEAASPGPEPAAAAAPSALLPLAGAAVSPAARRRAWRRGWPGGAALGETQAALAPIVRHGREEEAPLPHSPAPPGGRGRALGEGTQGGGGGERGGGSEGGG